MSSRPAWATPAQPGLKTPQGKAKLVGKNTSFEEQNSPFQGSQDPGPSRPVALAAFCLRLLGSLPTAVKVIKCLLLPEIFTLPFTAELRRAQRGPVSFPRCDGLADLGYKVHTAS